MSLAEFVASVEWEGKDASWDELVLKTLKSNGVFNLKQVGRAKIAGDNLQWDAPPTVGQLGFVEVRFPLLLVRRCGSGAHCVCL